jgi:hypothetical protein
MPAPFTAPPEGAQDNAEVAVTWIMANVPCFVATAPIEWTWAIHREAQKWSIKPAVLAAALLMAKDRGYDFAGVVPQLPVQPEGPVLKAAPPPKQAAIDTAKWLESEFQIASLAGNTREMERLAKAFADLLNNARVQGLPEAEIQWGAPLLRRAIVGPRESGPTRDPSGGGPYRTNPAMMNQRVPPRRGK